MKFIDKLAWIEIQDRKVLSTRTKGKDVFYIPGGKREWNESDKEALWREVKEELDVELILDSVSPFWIFEAQADGKEPWIVVRMSCYTSEYTWTLTPSAEIEQIERFTTKDKERSSVVDKIIFDYCKENDLID